jgi:hypothetical protein
MKPSAAPGSCSRQAASEQPNEVEIDEIVIRPTAQEF